MYLVEHLERRLGPITGGSRRKFDGVQIVHHAGGVFPGVEAWSSLGMSRHALAVPGTESRYSLEVFLAARTIPGGTVTDVGRSVEWIVEMMLGRHEARLRGDVQELPAAVHVSSVLDHVYFANPVYYDDEFYDVAVDPSGQRAGIVWLVPVGRREALYVREHGWRRFEEELERTDPDLFDPMRSQIV